jgi:hypothetical protein
MADFFNPTPDERRALDQLVSEIPAIQQTLVANHNQLTRPDRGAHQQQVAGSRVVLTIASDLPAELDRLGLFHGGSRHLGIGRISTGLGCPHAETDPDFLGLMVAFRHEGRRTDLITINDPTAPTDTPAEFIALLKATADAAGTEIPGGNVGSLGLPNVLASQAVLLARLTRHAGLTAARIATHVIGQTSRTVRSSSAYQPYWTGVLRARDVLGKFTFVPVQDVNTRRDLTPPPHHLSSDWRRRQREGPLDFRLYWIPFRSEHETPLRELSRAWREDHRVEVATVSFPATNPDSQAAKLTALLASEMGANQGNWIEEPGRDPSALPSTEYTAARALAYRRSQQERDALPDDRYHDYFERGEISSPLAAELVRRYREKVAAGHNVPDVGDVSDVG